MHSDGVEEKTAPTLRLHVVRHPVCRFDYSPNLIRLPSSEAVIPKLALGYF